ncbi:hypothetical protein QL285_036083 [Trifolium repens]|nr:hypothetical protein QL285_036083 [Trifolium repens]
MSLVLCILLLLLSCYTCAVFVQNINCKYFFSLNFDAATILLSPYTALVVGCSVPQSILDYNFLVLFILLRNVTCKFNRIFNHNQIYNWFGNWFEIKKWIWLWIIIQINGL